ncbi:MAG: hypothetical protein WDZ28_03440 [Simkaniaceae bacterium]
MNVIDLLNNSDSFGSLLDHLESQKQVRYIKGLNTYGEIETYKFVKYSVIRFLFDIALAFLEKTKIYTEKNSLEKLIQSIYKNELENKIALEKRDQPIDETLKFDDSFSFKDLSRDLYTLFYQNKELINDLIFNIAPNKAGNFLKKHDDNQKIIEEINEGYTSKLKKNQKKSNNSLPYLNDYKSDRERKFQVSINNNSLAPFQSIESELENLKKELDNSEEKLLPVQFLASQIIPNRLIGNFQGLLLAKFMDKQKNNSTYLLPTHQGSGDAIITTDKNQITAIYTNRIYFYLSYNNYKLIIDRHNYIDIECVSEMKKTDKGFKVTSYSQDLSPSYFYSDSEN